MYICFNILYLSIMKGIISYFEDPEWVAEESQHGVEQELLTSLKASLITIIKKHALLCTSVTDKKDSCWAGLLSHWNELPREGLSCRCFLLLRWEVERAGITVGTAVNQIASLLEESQTTFRNITSSSLVAQGVGIHFNHS